LKKLRVLHLYRTYFPETQGGMQEAIRQLCLATTPFGVENTVFALAKDPSPKTLALPEGQLVRERSWVEIASCDLGAWAAFSTCRKVANECDIIQVHYPWPFADLLLPFIRQRKQPVVVTYVSDIVRQQGLGQLYAPVMKRLLGGAARIVASSPNYAASSLVLQHYQDKLTCIPHCMGDGAGAEPDRCTSWQQRSGSGFFLFIGVLRYYKGLDFLLQAARTVVTPIVIVGEGPEGARLRQLATSLGLTHVHFLGHVSDEDKEALISLCRAVVFPSHLRSEAFGMTLLEGARAAKPLVCCEIGSGTTWVNLHEQTGLVVPGSNAAELAHALNALAADDALCQRLGHAARQRWQDFFTPGVVGQAYRQLYDALPMPA